MDNHSRRRRQRRYGGMVEIRLAEGIDMRHQVQYTMALQYALSCGDSDIVPRLYGDGSIDLQMCIDDDQIAHLSSAQIVQAVDARRLQQRRTDGLHFEGVRRAIHEVVQGLPSESPSHFPNEKADDERRNGIQDGITGQIA